jgi:hypothetical protein
LGLAVVSLIVLAIMGALAGLVLGRVFGAAAARNEKRPGGEEARREDYTAEGGPNDAATSEEGKRVAGLLFGGATAAAGIMTAVVGLVTAFWEYTFPNTVVLTSMAMVMGLVGYALGARTLGKVAAGLAAVAMVLGLAFSQGYMPGLEPSDHTLPDQEPRAGS